MKFLLNQAAQIGELLGNSNTSWGLHTKNSCRNLKYISYSSKYVVWNLDFIFTKAVQQLLKIFNYMKLRKVAMSSLHWPDLSLRSSLPEIKGLLFPWAFKLSIFRCFIRPAGKANLLDRCMLSWVSESLFIPKVLDLKTFLTNKQSLKQVPII